jgi:ribA/ribD-fused uncharacterized protein
LKKINGFQGDYRFLSNFWPCYLVYDNIVYPSIEHAYQASKVSQTSDKILISNCATPVEAKDIFKTRSFSRDPGWNRDKKLAVMEELLRIKFSGKDPFLTRALLETGNADLVEENNWDDIFWGVCNGTGENNLGKLLMKIRSELVEVKEKIIHLTPEHSNDTIADELSLSRRELYEKMIAFTIRNKEFWIST